MYAVARKLHHSLVIRAIQKNDRKKVLNPFFEFWLKNSKFLLVRNEERTENMYLKTLFMIK